MNFNYVNQEINALIIAHFETSYRRNSKEIDALIEVMQSKVRLSIEEVLLTCRQASQAATEVRVVNTFAGAVGDASYLIQATTTGDIRRKDDDASQQRCERNKIDKNHESALEREFAANLRVVKSAMVRV